MIPKIIHYCWFGGNPLPEDAIKCIESWKKFFPNYEIKEWNESNFDVYSIPYTKEAYEHKKYAFVSDYARYWILYNYGGLYFDTDVEVIQSFDEVLCRGSFMGLEGDFGDKIGNVWDEQKYVQFACNPGLGMGAEKGMDFYKEMIEIYHSIHYIFPNGQENQKTIVRLTTEHLVDCGIRAHAGIMNLGPIYIYPKKYFCPKILQDGSAVIFPETLSIHHSKASWVDHSWTFHDWTAKYASRLFPRSFVIVLRKIYHRIILKEK